MLRNIGFFDDDGDDYSAIGPVDPFNVLLVVRSMED